MLVKAMDKDQSCFGLAFGLGVACELCMKHVGHDEHYLPSLGVQLLTVFEGVPSFFGCTHDYWSVLCLCCTAQFSPVQVCSCSSMNNC